MAVDPSTLNDTCNVPPLKQWNLDWNSTIISNMISSDQLDSECMNECVKVTKECDCIQRLIFIMKFYSIWIHINISSSNPNINNKENENDRMYSLISLSEFITNLKYYSITHLINDWLHLRHYHWTHINIQYETRNIFQSMVRKCDDLNKCNIFERVNRDRQQTKNREIRKRLYFIKTQNDENESIEVITQQICDSMHDSIFHLPIIFLPQYKPQISDDDEEEKDDEKKSNEDKLSASELSMIQTMSENENYSDHSKVFEARKNAIKKLQNGQNHYYENSKFVTNLSHSQCMDKHDILNQNNNDKGDINNKFNILMDETKINDSEKKEDDEVMMNMISCYEFGIEMMYTERYEEYSKFGCIKEEVLENDECSIGMEQWNDTMNKAKQYKKCSKGKRIKSLIKSDEMDINIGDSLSLNALISCLLYTNFSDLQRRFSASTRRYKWQQNKTDKDIRIQHYRDYFYWGKTLMITIKCFGEKMHENIPFYHGINTELVFADFIAYFNSPTSTTISLSVASSFASNQGIILKLSARTAIQSKTKFINVSWFSDYPNEEERLFYGYHNELEIVSIFRTNFDYKNFIRALKILDILTDPNMIGDAGKKYAKLRDMKKMKKYLNYLLSMIKKCIDINGYNKEIQQQIENKDLKRKHWKTKDIPEYMMNIFNYFIKLQASISFDCNQCYNLNHQIFQYFITEKVIQFDIKNHCLNLPILIKLFPNSKIFKMDFGGKILTNEQLEYLCQMVSKFLAQQNGTKHDIQVIEFKKLIRNQNKQIPSEIGITPKNLKLMQKKYFSDGNCKVAFGRASVNFAIISNLGITTPNYEDIYIGNLHQMETVNDKPKHVWTMFISISKDKLIVPKSIKEVTYYLDSKLFKKSEIRVNKSPFNLKKKGLNTFEIRVKMVFRGKRKNANYFHTLDFDHSVTISNKMCQSDTCKHHGMHDIYHSDDIRKFDFYVCRRTDGGIGWQANT